MNEQKLVFVYNANSDLFSTVTGFAHKILSPSTYQCQLCTLTYTNFSVKREWKSFVDSLPVKTVFLYKDEFEKEFITQVHFPAVFILQNDTVKAIISDNEIENCKSSDELKSLIVSKLKEYVQHHHSNIQ